MIYLEWDSAFLLAPLVLIFIERCIISMGILQEFQGIYNIVLYILLKNRVVQYLEYFYYL